MLIFTGNNKHASSYQLASLHSKLDALILEVRQNTEVLKTLSAVNTSIAAQATQEIHLVDDFLPVSSLDEYHKLEENLSASQELQQSMVRKWYIISCINFYFDLRNLLFWATFS